MKSRKKERNLERENEDVERKKEIWKERMKIRKKERNLERENED